MAVAPLAQTQRVSETFLSVVCSTKIGEDCSKFGSDIGAATLRSWYCCVQASLELLQNLHALFHAKPDVRKILESEVDASEGPVSADGVSRLSSSSKGSN